MEFLRIEYNMMLTNSMQFNSLQFSSCLLYDILRTDLLVALSATWKRSLPVTALRLLYAKQMRSIHCLRIIKLYLTV